MCYHFLNVKKSTQIDPVPKAISTLNEVFVFIWLILSVCLCLIMASTEAKLSQQSFKLLFKPTSK